MAGSLADRLTLLRFRLSELRRSFRARSSTKGDPSVPPAYLQVLVSGSADDAHFLSNGRQHADSVRWILKDSGVPFESMGRFLDFGCGCGRVTRHLTGQGPAVEGCDYNGTLVSWCKSTSPMRPSRRTSCSRRRPTRTAGSTGSSPSRS